MAKVRLLDEFLCPICMDYFTQAKRLSCQHHFCETCIATYASRHLSNDRQGGASDVTLPCPVCGTTFHWPEGGAQALQADLFLNRMMEVLKVGQRDVTQYDDVLLQAEDSVDKHDEVIRDDSATDDVTRCDHHLDDKAIALCLDCPQAMCARCVKRALEDPAHPCSVHVHQCVSMEESDTEVTARYIKVKVEVVEIKQQLQEIFDTIASAIADVKREKHKVKAEATARHGKAVVMLDECLSSVDEQVTTATGAILQRLHALKDEAHCTVSRLKDEYMRAAPLLSDKVKVKGTVQKLLTLQQLRKSLIDIRYSLATISEAVGGHKSAAAVLSVDITRPDVAQAAKNLCMTLVGVVQHHLSTVSWKTGALSEDMEQSPCCADDVSLTDIFGRYTDTADTVSQCHAGRTFLYEMGCLSAKVDGTLRLSAIRSKLAALTLGPEGDFLMIDKQHDLVVVLDPLAKVRRTFVANQPIGVCWWKDDTILISHGEAAHCVSIYRLSGQHGAGEYVNTIGGEVLRSADAICTTPDGHIVVSDILARRVFVFDIEGRVKARIHKNGDTILFYRPHQLAVTHTGKIVVSDSRLNCVKVFSAGGQLLFNYGTYGDGHGQMIEPRGVAVDCLNRIIVIDYRNRRLHILREDGLFLAYVPMSAFCRFNKAPSFVTARQDGRLLLSNREGFVKIVSLIE